MPRETKAQRIARQDAEHAKAIKQNLCWPNEPEPQPYTADVVRMMAANLEFNEVVRAYTFNAYSKRVTYGCFNQVNHNTDGAMPCSQTTGGPWFGSSHDAALALEWAMCRRFSAELIDLRSKYIPSPLPGSSHD